MHDPKVFLLLDSGVFSVYHNEVERRVSVLKAAGFASFNEVSCHLEKEDEKVLNNLGLKHTEKTAITMDFSYPNVMDFLEAFYANLGILQKGTSNTPVYVRYWNGDLLTYSMQNGTIDEASGFVKLGSVFRCQDNTKGLL